MTLEAVMPRATHAARAGSDRILRLLAIVVALMITLAPTAFAQVEIGVERFGVGGAYRPGDPTAIRATVTWRGLEPRPIQLVWEVENADGDITEQLRTVVLNPGQGVTRWLYGRPAPRIEPQTTFTIRAFADDDGRRGAELGVHRFSPSSAASALVALDQRLIAVMGDGRMGLDGYTVTLPSIPYAVGDHELTRIVSGLGARELPDRWEGLASFEALVWSTAPPQGLGLDEADALREWIRRGGRLVIILPQSGNPWGLGAAPSHPLHDLLPSRTPRRVEGVPFTRVVDLLSKTPELLNERAATTLTTWDARTLDRSWEPLLAIPAARSETTGRLIAGDDGLGGAIVAIQRRLGFGQITLVGIDVDAANRLRLQPGNFPQADAFWNRILGRRADSPLAADVAALENHRPSLVNLGITATESIGGGLAAGPIAMSRDAVRGTLAALVIFSLYWIVAGPGGFAALRARRLTRHAWVAFVATAAIFTGVAWLLSTLARQVDVRIEHVTFLDHVSYAGGVESDGEPQLQRAWTWFSAYLPGYGPTRISVDSEPGQRNLLTSWIAPPSGVPQRFPNTDRYQVPLASPADYRVPARATAVQMEARWMGSIDPRWGSMPMAVAGSQVAERVTHSPAPEVSLTGQLRHGLPGPLTNVLIVHVSGLRTPLRTEQPATASRPAPVPLRPGELLNLGQFRVRSVWEPGTILDLGAELYPNGPATLVDLRSTRTGFAGEIDGRFAELLQTRMLGALGEATLVAERRVSMWSQRTIRQFDALSLYSLLPPPPWSERPPSNVTPARLLRTFGRDLDLAGWFGRPCVIIIGTLDQSEAPVPIAVDGTQPPSAGVTIVRWICPLPVDADLIVAEPRSRTENTSSDAP